MKDNIAVDEHLLKAFHLMFDHFPECVHLIHKSRQIAALNPAGQAIGREAGMICAQQGPAENHRGCLAARTLQTGKASWIQKDSPLSGQKFVNFWLPLDGYPDFYLHFAVGMRKDYSLAPED
jgi:hypothetical protein